MKKLLLTTALMLGLQGAVQAAPAKIYASNLANGVTPSNGLVGLSSATVRLGAFPEAFDFSGKSFAQLNAAFILAAESSAPLNAGGLRGFFDLGLDYETSPGLDGKAVFVWVLNGSDPATAPQQAIFSTSRTFVVPNGVYPNVTYVSPDSSAPGLVAHIGSLATGNNIGGVASAHKTAGSSYRVTDVIATRSPADEILFQGSSVTFTAVADSSFTPTYQWRRNGTNISGATSATYTINNLGTANSGNYDVRVVDGPVTKFSNVVPLTVFSAKPTFVQQPSNRVVALGSGVTLNALAVAPTGINYVWKKGTKAIESANEPQYELTASATSADAGAYLCAASNSTTVTGSGSTNSNTVQVVVLNTAARSIGGAVGATVKMSAIYFGKATSFRWKRNGVPLNNGGQFAGATTKSLSVKSLSFAANHGDVYTCEVTAGTPATGQDSLDSGTFTLSVFTGPPAFTNGSNPIVLPEATLGEMYSYQIPASNTSVFGVTGLPKGLKVDTSTGLISGIPTSAKTDPAVPFSMVFTLTNGKLKTTRPATMIVKRIGEAVDGTYTMVVNRSTFSGGYSHTGNLGGRINITINSLGSVTGQAVFGGAKSVSFKGFLTNPGAATPTGSIRIARPAISVVPLVFNFSIQTVGGDPTNKVITGSLTDASLVAGQSAVRTTTVSGWRNRYSSANPATAYQGLYHAAVIASGDSATRPKGASTLAITVKADGKVGIAGTSADGQGLTGSTFVGPTGQVLMFSLMYAPAKGSMHGFFQLNPGDTIVKDTIGGAITWMRPANTSTATRAYAAGFNLASSALTIGGGRYTLSAPTNLILDTTVNTEALLEFSDAGLSADEPPTPSRPDIRVRLLATNKYSVVGANPRVTKLKVDAAKGTFSGSFTYDGAANAKAVNFQGRVIRNGGEHGEWNGFGFFLLTQTPGETSDPVQSGLVTLSVAP